MSSHLPISFHYVDVKRGGASDPERADHDHGAQQLLRMANAADRSLAAELRRALRSHIEQADEQAETS